jgi:hypothetical protein
MNLAPSRCFVGRKITERVLAGNVFVDVFQGVARQFVFWKTGDATRNAGELSYSFETGTLDILKLTITIAVK